MIDLKNEKYKNPDRTESWGDGIIDADSRVTKGNALSPCFFVKIYEYRDSYMASGGYICQ